MRTLAVVGDKLYAGGDFTGTGEQSINRIAKWDGAIWSSLGNGLDGAVYSIAVNGNDLYAGGTFEVAGEDSICGLARWDGSVWTTPGIWKNGYVMVIAADENKIYAGGWNFVVHGDGKNWNMMPGEFYDQWFIVRTLVCNNGNVYMGGCFCWECSCDYLYRWNGSLWLPM